MKRKGFTLIELLVVIAIIALLMSILMPALSRVREMANRVVCGSQLNGLVKGMLVYAGEDENGRLPRAGFPGGTWGATANAGNDAGTVTKEVAFGWSATNPGKATISASLYLLVKRDYASAKQFMCKSDAGVTEFKTGNPAGWWDFGGTPRNCVSYAYHMPYTFTHPTAGLTQFALSAASDPGLAVLSDRNPYAVVGNPATAFTANSTLHQDEGQNIAYIDSHVKFDKTPYVGLNGDNIYTIGLDGLGYGIEGAETVCQYPPTVNTGPMSKVDSLLVNEK